LGLPLNFLENKEIIEFGPGGGWNAIATSFFKPKLFVFVDASNKSVDELKKKIRNKKINSKKIVIHKLDIFNYKNKKKFDCAIAEGIIPGQLNPAKMLKHISNTVKKNGILITTTHSGCSLLSEVCRRLLRIKIIQESYNFEESINIASNIFYSHLKNLKSSTRSTKDWVLDSILSEYSGDKIIFNISDTLDCLEKNFYFYQSQPSFLIDDRWYKHVKIKNKNTNDLLREQYPRIEVSFLDYRIPLFDVLKIDNKKIKDIEFLSVTACKVHNSMIKDQNYKKIDSFLYILKNIEQALPKDFQITKNAINDYIKDMPKFINQKITNNNIINNKIFTHFKNWWGRGQQYSSFIKK
jgi:2-polyprenyl-3-methyl-5-hydroxy-6-metoxy-1,4-benzoquinol methylase